MEYITQNEKETKKIGRKIASKLCGGEVIFLSGILGAGKTVLVRGIAEELGIKGKITSPTFNILRVYNCDLGKFYHFDCYRLKRYADLKNLGWEEIINEKNAVVVLEWPECIKGKNITSVPKPEITLVKIDIKGDKRNINVKELG